MSVGPHQHQAPPVKRGSIGFVDTGNCRAACRTSPRLVSSAAVAASPNFSSTKPRPNRSRIERPSRSQACGARQPGCADGVIMFWIVGRRRVVGDADRRRLIAIAKLQARGAEHAADIFGEACAEPQAQRFPRVGLVLDRRHIAGECAVREMKLGRHAHVAQADRPPFGCRMTQEDWRRPSPATPRQASSQDRRRRRCRYSCRARRSATAGAPRRRRGTRGPWRSARRPHSCASRCLCPSTPRRSAGLMPVGAKLCGRCCPESACRRCRAPSAAIIRSLDR